IASGKSTAQKAGTARGLLTCYRWRRSRERGDDARKVRRGNRKWLGRFTTHCNSPWMEKPIVFLSHSSRDSKTLNRLKFELENKTHGTIDFFLSCDGESIPFGRNWVATIQEALEKAKLTFVFLSRHSLNSGWVHFESGFVYGKDIRVIPVAMPGVDFGKLSPPLSLLQGFNLHS